MNTVGMQRQSSRMKTGEVGSQAVYPRASKVARIPPDGKLDASGSCCTRFLPSKVSIIPPLPSYSINESCFSAVDSVKGWNQWLQWVTPCSIAHCFMPAATPSATSRSRGLPLSIQSKRAWRVLASKYFCIFCRLKTSSPKYSEGRPSGIGYSAARFLNAASIASNLSLLIYFYIYFLKRYPYCKIYLVERRIIDNLSIKGNAE